MKKSFTFYLKTAFLLIGATLIIIAGFSPVQSQLHFVNSDEEVEQVFEIGFNHFLWYVTIFATTTIFAIGYFFNGLINKVLVYVFTPLFALGFIFLSAITMITWGATPFIPNFEYGYPLMWIGSLLVITATIISMHRKTKMVTPLTDSDILDN